VHASDAYARWGPPQARSWAISCAIAGGTAGCFRPSYDRPECGPGGACPSGLSCSPVAPGMA
jgi:hypothetical protein